MIYDPFLLICCSVSKSCPTLSDHMDCSTPGFPVLHYLPEFTQNHVHWVSDAIQPSHPLSPLLLPSIFPSIRVLSNELDLHIRWPKHRSFSFSISPSNGYPWSILPPNTYPAFAMCQCCVHCSTWRLCFHPHSNPVRLGLSISPLHRWENRGSHRLGDLTKRVGSKARIEGQVIWILCYFPS